MSIESIKQLAQNRTVQIVSIVVAILIVVTVMLIIFWPRQAGKQETTTNETSPSFTCPTDKDYVNCMPQAFDENDKAARQAADRQAEYCKFIEENCPNVSVVY